MSHFGNYDQHDNTGQEWHPQPPRFRPGNAGSNNYHSFTSNNSSTSYHNFTEYDERERAPRRSSRSRSPAPAGRRNRSRSRSRSNSRSDGESYRSASSLRNHEHNRLRHNTSRRSRSRSRSHGHEQRRRNRRSRSRSRERGREQDRSRHQRDCWSGEPTSATLMLRGLPSNIDELTLKSDVANWNIPVVDVRLIRDRLTGAPRGFAYVDTASLEIAGDWMARNRGEVMIGGATVEMVYSVGRFRGAAEPAGSASSSSTARRRDADDWWCSKCTMRNFARRVACHRCGKPRGPEDRQPLTGAGPNSGSNLGSGSQILSTQTAIDDPTPFVGNTPCNTLLIRDLDALTNEDRICETLSGLQASVSPKSCQVMRDDLTHASLCYALVEYSSVAQASDVLKWCSRASANHGRYAHDDDCPSGRIEIGGKLVTVNYAKFTFTTMLATIEQAKQQSTTDYYSNFGETESSRNSHSAVRNSHDSLADRDRSTPATWASAAASSSASSADPYRQPPDTSTFSYDSSSGYYYDAKTKYYYDANSGYFYDASTASYLFWNAALNTYTPVAASGSTPGVGTSSASVASTTASNVNSNAEPDSKKKDKKEKKKDAPNSEKAIAAKIAKDMERWAKQVNAQKEAASKPTRGAGEAAAFTQQSFEPEPPTYAVPLQLERMNNDFNAAAELDEAVSDAEKSLLDWQKQICALCKRQFPDSETMVKHVRMSELHKNNVATLRRTLAQERALPDADELTASSSSATATATPVGSAYRDRAKERREKPSSSAVARTDPRTFTDYDYD